LPLINYSGRKIFGDPYLTYPETLASKTIYLWGNKTPKMMEIPYKINVLAHFYLDDGPKNPSRILKLKHTSKENLGHVT
jgi:hypothetical protein